LEHDFGTTIRKGQSVEELARRRLKSISDKPDELQRLATSPDASTAEMNH
jgi:hypothetical protein